MTDPGPQPALTDLTLVEQADVYKRDGLAAHLHFSSRWAATRSATCES
jgi:hypothetical protein